jgi:two-component system, response regulator, stage 0 sporulation protein F
MKDFEGKTVLIVDDEQEIRELLKDEFEYYGAVVLEAANGKIAAALWAKQPSDFVVTDIRMPGGDGIELLRTIKAHTRDVPVLVMSAFSDISRNEANELGADAFFSKPFNLEKLRATALSLINSESKSPPQTV